MLQAVNTQLTAFNYLDVSAWKVEKGLERAGAPASFAFMELRNIAKLVC
jgi:hypothetical protein